MPRGKTSSPVTKFEVINCVVGYLPQRTQARLRAVAKDVKAMVPSTISAPPYADMLDNMCEQVMSLSRGSSVTIYADGMVWGLDVGTHSDGVRIKIQAGNSNYQYWATVSVCQPSNFKFIMYRAIANSKVITMPKSSCSIEMGELMEHLAAVEVQMWAKV